MTDCREDRCARLLALVRQLVEESGTGSSFDAEHWTQTWLATPLPALGGDLPISHMDTEQGYEQIAQLLLRMRSGAFS